MVTSVKHVTYNIHKCKHLQQYVAHMHRHISQEAHGMPALPQEGMACSIMRLYFKKE